MIAAYISVTEKNKHSYPLTPLLLIIMYCQQRLTSWRHRLPQELQATLGALIIIAKTRNYKSHTRGISLSKTLSLNISTYAYQDRTCLMRDIFQKKHQEMLISRKIILKTHSKLLRMRFTNHIPT